MVLHNFSSLIDNQFEVENTKSSKFIDQIIPVHISVLTESNFTQKYGDILHKPHKIVTDIEVQILKFNFAITFLFLKYASTFLKF